MSEYWRRNGDRHEIKLVGLVVLHHEGLLFISELLRRRLSLYSFGSHTDNLPRFGAQCP